MTLRNFIETYKIDKSYLATRVGMSRAVFGNKLHGNNNSRFSGGELVRIYEEIERLGKEMLNFVKTV